jgi:hypothetical protein
MLMGAKRCGQEELLLDWENNLEGFLFAFPLPTGE